MPSVRQATEKRSKHEGNLLTHLLGHATDWGGPYRTMHVNAGRCVTLCDYRNAIFDAETAVETGS
jgi:hypothetical protein